MSYFISPEIQGIYIETMGKLRSDIGREVILKFDPTYIDCPNCSYDPIKKRSTGKYSPTVPYPSGIAGPTNFESLNMRECPICTGIGKVASGTVTRKFKCIVSQLSKEDAEKTVLGKDYKKNYELQTSIDAKIWFETCKIAIVDGYPTKVVAVDPAGIGTLSQIVVYSGG